MPVEKRNYAYYRLSQEDGDVESGPESESCSISSQRTCVQRYLLSQNMLPDSFEEVIDDGYSGTNMNRPGIARLLRLAESGQVGTIIVRDLSRFARNYLEAGHYLEFVFPLLDIRFISINDQFDSAALGETTGGLELAIRNLMNQMYSQDISRKIKSTVDLKKLSGEYAYGAVPFGYKKGARHNTIEVDEPAALIVKEVFRLAAEGRTITQIAHTMNERGVITPSVYLAATRGKYKTRKDWTYESVRNLLENRIYTGDTIPFKSHVVRVGSNRVKHIPVEMQEVLPDTHEAIISRETFYLARQVVKSNVKSKPAAPPNPFTSKLVCGCCGNRLVKGKAQNKFWRCATHRYVPDSPCANVKIEEKKLCKVVLRAVLSQCKLLDEHIQRAKEQSRSVRSSQEILESQRRALRNDLDRLQNDKMRYYEDYATGRLTKEGFATQRAEISSREENIKLQLQVAENQLAQLQERLKASTDQLVESERVTAYQEVTELTPELVKALIRQITLRPDGSVVISWNFRDELAGLVELEQTIAEEQAV